MSLTKVIIRLGPMVTRVLIPLLIIVLVVFAILRSVETYGGGVPAGLFEARYLEHPYVTALHMLSGIVFVVFAPLQFLSEFRARNLHWHRGLGRILVCCALLAGIYGMASILVLPVFGGVASATASWFFGSLFIFSAVRAYWCARRRFIAKHREWMIRTFALALGVGTQRLVLALMMATTDNTMSTNFGPALWLGFGINLLIAEIWINTSRRNA